MLTSMKVVVYLTMSCWRGMVQEMFALVVENKGCYCRDWCSQIRLTGWPRKTFEAKQHDHHLFPAHGALLKRAALVGAVSSADSYPQTSDFTAWSDTKQARVSCYEDGLLRHQLEQSSRRKQCTAGAKPTYLKEKAGRSVLGAEPLYCSQRSAVLDCTRESAC